jgi:hypothetical protein
VCYCFFSGQEIGGATGTRDFYQLDFLRPPFLKTCSERNEMKLLLKAKFVVEQTSAKEAFIQKAISLASHVL